MRRIDKGSKAYPDKYLSEIMITCCPGEIGIGPTIDVSTFIESDGDGRVSLDIVGCRGITCQECWETEIGEGEGNES